MSKFQIGNRMVGDGHPVYFIAEIGSNHEGSLEKAKHLCSLAKRSGADCAKFQHYRADKLASRGGFEKISNLAHYKENPYDVFKKYEVPWEWTPVLKEYCDSIGIEFMSTPYDLEAVDHLEPYVNAYKIGSGDITYHELVTRALLTRKPLLISTGASNQEDINLLIYALSTFAYNVFGDHKYNTCIMHCNTNYDGVSTTSLNLSTLRRLHIYGSTMGLSDHTTSWAVIAYAVGAGAKVIERHFTDNRITNSAPDSPFAMDPYDWEGMVGMVRELERLEGNGIKKVEENERETVVLQRRCIRSGVARDRGWTLRLDDLVYLRPCPADGIPPYLANEVVGRRLVRDIPAGDYIRRSDLT